MIGDKGPAPDPIDLNTIKEIDEARGGDGSEKSIRETYRLCAKGELPVFKMGNKWRGRSRTIAARIERLERRAVGE